MQRIKRVVTPFIRKSPIRRAHVAAARMCCERNAMATFGVKRNRKVGRILCYHSIGQPNWGVNDVTPRDFRRHIELSLAAGKRFVPASEIARTGGGPNDLAITFDDGLRSVLTNAVPILKEFGIPWSLYVVTDWCDQSHPWGQGVMLTWREVEAIVVAGGEIGSHSVTHPDFGVLEPNLIEDELGGSREMIRERLGFAPNDFAIPLGQSKNWTEAAARAARTVGYSTIFAQAEETRPPDTIARTFVTKFDGERIFRALLEGAFDHWEEWV